jgi:DNA-binding NtrC family response regulator
VAPCDDREGIDEHATLRLDTNTESALLRSMRITLVIVMPEGKLEQVLERGQSCVLGRSDECDATLSDPSISRQHARVSFSESGALFVEDLGSANGTRVGARGLAAGESGELVPGDVLELGSVFVVVDRVGMHERKSVASGDPPAPSPGMEALHALVARVAKSTLSVLILGETGAGKEVLAQRLHDLSPRAGRPFLKLNCAALSEQLLESELFGHERGAFTGAVHSKPGLLETADTGTIFLDEVGELPLPLQAKLLRVLEDRKVLRVGGLKPKEIDVRFVAATNRDPPTEIAGGRFRQDLYFRLNGITLYIPPLRERVVEIEPLALKFAAAAAKAQGRAEAPTLTPRARLALERYRWPGNVRELKNVIERAVVLSERHIFEVEDLGLSHEGPPRPSTSNGPTSPFAEGAAALLKADVDALEQRRILDALAECGGNQTRAAKLLGISRGTLVSRLERFGVSRPRKRP